MWHQNWHQYVYTLLCLKFFFVNLLHIPGVWFLTFDIFCDIMTLLKLKPPQPITGLFFILLPNSDLFGNSSERPINFSWNTWIFNFTHLNIGNDHLSHLFTSKMTILPYGRTFIYKPQVNQDCFCFILWSAAHKSNRRYLQTWNKFKQLVSPVQYNSCHKLF